MEGEDEWGSHCPSARERLKQPPLRKSSLVAVSRPSRFPLPFTTRRTYAARATSGSTLRASPLQTCATRVVQLAEES